MHNRVGFFVLALFLSPYGCHARDMSFKTTCPKSFPNCSPANQCKKDCHKSCGKYCQNKNGPVCGEVDCMTCPKGFELKVLYDDQTGKCVKKVSKDL